MQKLKKLDRREDASEKKKADLPIFLQKFRETFVCRIVPCTLHPTHISQKRYFMKPACKKGLSEFNSISSLTGRNANDLISIFL